MSRVDFDVSELRTLAADLTKAPTRALGAVSGVVSKGALNIKSQLQEEMGASRSFAHLSRSITYDLDADGLGAEIGPTKRQGRRTDRRVGANIAYFGTSKGGGSVPDPQGALDAEAPKVLDALGKAIEDVL